MKKIILLLLISISGYSQTLLKLKAIEYAPGAGYCVITNTAGVQTYTPCSSITSTTNLVPYTGATSDVDLDTHTLNAKSLHVKGTAGNGHIGLKHQSSNITANTSESSLGANSSGNPVWKNDGNPIQQLATTDQSITINGVTKTFTSTPTFTTTLQDVVNQSPILSGQIESPSSNVLINFDDSGIAFTTNGGVFDFDGEPILTDANTYTLTNKTYSNSILSGSVNVTGLTASKLVGTDASKNLNSITVGSGLSLTSGTLSATGGSTSIVSTNSFITVSGSSITAVPNYVTPEMYGAVGNGSTNDATALQNAINSGKKVVGDLSKSYLTASTLTLTTNVTLENLNLKVTSNIAVVSIEGNYNTLTNCSITGTTSLGHGAANYGISIIGNAGLTSYRVGNKVQGCYFNNLNTAVYTASMVGTGSGGNHEGALTVSNTMIENCTTGINLSVRAEYNNISNTKIYKCTTGFSNTGGNNSFTGGQITDCTTGFDLVGGTNDGHSVASGVMLNHNTDNIKSTSLTKGYLFNGCMVYAGNVSLTSSFGVTFESCAFSTLSITCTSNTNTAFNNCKFVTTPTISTTGTAPIYFNSNFETAAPSGQVSSGNYYLTANVTNTASATPVTAITIPVQASKRYYIDGSFHVGVNNTGGIKFQVTLPSGATMFVEFMGNAATATAFSRATVTTSASLTSVAFWTANSTAGMIRIAGEVNIDTTAGNVTIDFAPNTNTQTATVYQLGTCVKARLLN